VTALSWLLPPLILFAGWTLWTRFPSAEREIGDPIHEAFAATLCGIFVTGVLGLALAELGWFTPWTLGGALIAISAASLRLPHRAPQWSPVSRRTALGVLVVGLLAVASGAPASEDLMGGRDPGVYANTASWLAREGSLRIHADVLETVPADTRPLFYEAAPGKPFIIGFYVASDGPNSEVIPQFLHLLPVFLAIGFWLGGPAIALLVPPLFGVLSALALFLFVRRMLGVGAGLLAAALLVVNLAQIWIVRSPYSEGPMQLAVFSMLWCIVNAFESGGVRWGMLGGLAIGTALLLRLDALLLPAVVVPAIVLVDLSRPRRGSATMAFLAITVPLAVWGTVHCWLFSGPYLRALGRLVTALWIATAAGLVIAGLALRYRMRSARLVEWVHRHASTSWMVGAIALSATFAFGLWVRPHLQPFEVLGGTLGRSYNEETLARVAWYVSRPGIVAALVGVILLLRRWLVRRQVEWAPFLVVFLAFSLLYFWKAQISPDHPWAMRRYVPVVVPGVFVAIAAVSSWLWAVKEYWRLLARVAAVAIVAVVATHEIVMARPYWNHREKSGLLHTLDRLDALLPDDAVVLFSQPGLDPFVGTPIAMHLGIDALPVVPRPDINDEERRHRFEAQLVRWLDARRPVFYVTTDDSDRTIPTERIRWERVGIERLEIRTSGPSTTSPPRRPGTLGINYHVLRARPLTASLDACAPAVLSASTVLFGRTQGIYASEYKRGIRFRWTRPAARLVFPTCDRTRGRPDVLRIRARCGDRVSDGRCRINVDVNHSPAGAIEPGDEWRTFDLPMPAAATAAPSGAIDIRFTGPRFVPAERGTTDDARELSFQFASAALLPAGSTVQPQNLNLIAADARDVWGIGQVGFYREEYSDGRMFRWTAPHAAVIAPLGSREPRSLRVELWGASQPARRITLKANGCTLFDGVVPHSEWSTSFPLAGCLAAGETLEIAIESAAARVPNDRRELGVAVRSVRIE